MPSSDSSTPSRQQTPALIAAVTLLLVSVALLTLSVALSRRQRGEKGADASGWSAQTVAPEVLARVAECETAVQRDPDDYELRLQLADALIEAGQLDRAAQTLRPLTPEDPHLALLVWGRLYAQQGETELAETCLRGAYSVMRDSPRPGVELAGLLFGTSRKEEAGLIARENANAHPENYEAQICAAAMTVYRGIRRTDTRIFLDRAEKLAPDRAEVYALKAYASTAHPEEAIRLAHEALKRDPNNTDALYVLGWMRIEGELNDARAAEAETCLRRGLALEPDQPMYCSRLGILYRRLGRLDEAAEWLERSLALAPDAAGAWYALTGVYERQKRERLATTTRTVAKALIQLQAKERTCVEILTHSPKDADTWARLAELDYLRHQTSVAIERATRALSLDSRNALAAQVLRQAMEAPPDPTTEADWLRAAESDQKAGRPVFAIAAASQVLAHNLGQPQAAAVIAQAAESMSQ